MVPWLVAAARVRKARFKRAGCSRSRMSSRRWFTVTATETPHTKRYNRIQESRPTSTGRAAHASFRHCRPGAVDGAPPYAT